MSFSQADTTISIQSVMKRGASCDYKSRASRCVCGCSRGSRSRMSLNGQTAVRESGLSVEAGVTGPVYVESWGSVVVKCLCCLVARLG